MSYNPPLKDSEEATRAYLQGIHYKWWTCSRTGWMLWSNENLSRQRYVCLWSIALPCGCFPCNKHCQVLTRTGHCHLQKKIRSAILVVIFVPVWAGQPSWFIAQPSPKDLVTRLPLTSLRIRRKFDNCMWPAKRAPAEPPSDKGNIKLFPSFRGALHETI